MGVGKSVSTCVLTGSTSSSKSFQGTTNGCLSVELLLNAAILW